ncbi:MAG: hypothetical protein ACRD25_07320, partial [Terracidiphilus sp.]
MFVLLKLHRHIAVLFAFVGTLLFAGFAAAQRGGAGPQASSDLSPAARAVISRLACLGTLPDRPWKMH